MAWSLYGLRYSGSLIAYYLIKTEEVTHKLDQCSETNVMHFLFNLLRTKGLYMFCALLAHPQEALHKRDLVYCMHVMLHLVQLTDITCMQYTKCHLCSAS
jgi:hypothetical protein